MGNNDIVAGFDDEVCADLEISLRSDRGCLVLALVGGGIDHDGLGCFGRRVRRAIDAGFVRLVFDLTGMRFFHHELGALTSFLRLVRPRGGDIALAAVPPKILEDLQLLGFSQFLNIRDTLEEAVAFFASAGRLPTFPHVFRCPICNRRVRASKPGHFRCRECGATLVVDALGGATPG